MQLHSRWALQLRLHEGVDMNSAVCHVVAEGDRELDKDHKVHKCDRFTPSDKRSHELQKGVS